MFMITNNKKIATVYGVGNFWRKIKKRVNEEYEIALYMDKRVDKKNDIFSMEDIGNVSYDVLIVSIYDIKTCFEVIEELVYRYKVPYAKIKLGYQFSEEYGHNRISVAEGGILFAGGNNADILARNIDEYNNIREIYEKNSYSFFLNNNRKEVVIDIGMNVGAASLFFLQSERVSKVYAFEPFGNTYEAAVQNFKRNGYLNSERLEYFQYGISDITETRNIVFNPEMSCGQSTLTDVNRNARSNYTEWGLIDNKEDIIESINVVDIKDILEKVRESYEKENIILKMNCEGEEYKILPRLEECHLLKEISIIMVEWHYKGEEAITDILQRNHFGYWNFKHTAHDTGFIYAFKR